MTVRCRHEIETKPDYPDYLICRKCETTWNIVDYMGKTAKELMHNCPFEVRQAVLKRQVDTLNIGDWKEKTPNGR